MIIIIFESLKLSFERSKRFDVEIKRGSVVNWIKIEKGTGNRYKRKNEIEKKDLTKLGEKMRKLGSCHLASI